LDIAELSDVSRRSFCLQQ